MMHWLLFRTGYRTAAFFISAGTWAMVFFLVTWASVVSAQTMPIPAQDLGQVFGVPMWHLIVSLGSGGASYGAMLMRVKRLEEEQQTLKAEFKELVKSLHEDHDMLVKTVEKREFHATEMALLKERIAILEASHRRERNA